MREHRSRIGPCILIVLALSGCATVPREIMYPNAPTLLPGTEAAMNSPGFWIGHNSDPDRIILDQKGIDAFNSHIRDQGFVRDLANIPPMTGADLKKELESTTAWIAGAKVFQANGKKVDKAFLSPMIEQMDFASIPENIDASYGFLVSQTDMRVLPTRAPLFDSPGDVFIDNLQASSLEPGTPLAILYRSKDGNWLYAASEIVTGWIPADRVAIASKDAFLNRCQNSAKAVVTENRADIYADEKMTNFLEYARMGTSLVLADPETGEASADAASSDAASSGEISSGKLKVLLANRDEAGNYRETSGWVESRTVSLGCRAYTPRTIYEQAFRLLNAPYGWGGTFGEQDCSQFLCEVFATVGITLPRNSGKQARIGAPLAGFTEKAPDAEKIAILEGAGIPGATILRLPGHIMLYLGTINGEPYVIHATWAYREKRGWKEIVRLINRVTVSNLELGSGSSIGTHLHRLTAATVITRPE